MLLHLKEEKERLTGLMDRGGDIFKKTKRSWRDLKSLQTEKISGNMRTSKPYNDHKMPAGSEGVESTSTRGISYSRGITVTCSQRGG